MLNVSLKQPIDIETATMGLIYLVKTRPAHEYTFSDDLWPTVIQFARNSEGGCVEIELSW